MRSGRIELATPSSTLDVLWTDGVLVDARLYSACTPSIVWGMGNVCCCRVAMADKECINQNFSGGPAISPSPESLVYFLASAGPCANHTVCSLITQSRNSQRRDSSAIGTSGPDKPKPTKLGTTKKSCSVVPYLSTKVNFVFLGLWLMLASGRASLAGP